MAFGVVKLDDLVLSDSTKRPAIGWQVNSMEGWASVPDGKQSHVDRPQGHGTFSPGPVTWRTGAAVTLTGRFRSPDPAERLRARDLVAAVAGNGGTHTLSFTNELGTTSRQVSIERFSPEDDHGLLDFPWTMDCFSDDPRRYSPTQSIARRFIMPVPTDGIGNTVTNPSFDVSAAGWVGRVDQGAPKALVRVEGDAPRGGFFGRLAVGTSPASERVIARYAAPVQSSTSAYLVSARSNAAHAVTLTVGFWNADGVVLATAVVVTDVVPAPGVWRQLAVVEVPPPTGTTHVTLTVESQEPWAAGDVLDVDAAAITNTGEYNDGDSAGWEWIGEPGASASADLMRMVLTNYGTADTVPHFRAVGTSAGVVTFNELETGRKLTYYTPITTSSSWELDIEMGVMLINGKPRTGLRGVEWPVVPAGQTRSYTVTSEQNMNLEVTASLASAWW